MMPAYNYQARFAPLVESGEKTHTIRPTDKGARPGMTAYHYTGQRTKLCRKLGEGIITSVQPIRIGRERRGWYAITIKGNDMNKIHELDFESFAKADGFTSGDEMVAWFSERYGLPFNGFLHQWVPVVKGELKEKSCNTNSE